MLNHIKHNLDQGTFPTAMSASTLQSDDHRRLVESWTSFASGASGIMSTYRRLWSAVTSQLGRAQYSRPYLACLFQ